MTLKKYLITGLLFTVIMFAAQSKSYGGGFPVRPGRLSFSVSGNYFFADKAWDEYARKGPFPDNGIFHSYSYSVYAEYGLSRRFTMSFQLPYVSNTFATDHGTTYSSGVTDAEVGIRYYLANINYKYYFSLQGTAIVPLYNNINLGYKQEGAEIKLSMAGSGHLFKKNFYFILENGVREYFGGEAVFQDRYNATVGLTIDKKFKQQVSVSVGGFYATSINKSFSPNPNTSKNFAFDQTSVSYGYAITKSVSMFVTGGMFVYGYNTGAGKSIAASLNYRFDTR